MIQEEILDRATLQKRCLRNMSASDFYDLLQQRGMYCEGIFRGVQQVWCGDHEALGYISLSQQLLQDIQADAYQLPPGLFDICSQLLIAALPPALLLDKSIQNVVASMRYFKVYRPLSTDVWAYVQLMDGEAPMSDTIEGNLHIFAEDGTTLATVQGLRLQQNKQADANLTESSRSPVTDCLYTLQWEAHEQPSLPDRFQKQSAEKWLLFIDEQGIGQQLQRLLEERGHQCISVSRGSQFRQFSEYAYQINHTDPQAYTLLTESIQQQYAPAAIGVVHLWSLDATSTEQTNEQTLLADQALGVESALRIMQTNIAMTSESPGLWFVTRGAQVVSGDQTTVAISQAPLWGLGKVFAAEYPEFWGGLIDLDPDDRDSAAQLLQSIVNKGETAEDLLAFRQGKRYEARLVHSQPPILNHQPTPIRSDASYLITGGLQGIGLAITQWFVEQGARYLVLIGHTPLPPRPQWPSLKPGDPSLEQVAAIHALESGGAQVQYAAVDVTNRAQLTALLTTLPYLGYPELRGVVHAASIWQDSQGQSLVRPITSLTIKALREIFRPKVLGSWLLHTLVKEMPLDFLVSFSSGASLIGSATQGGYAAASEFLDILAPYQRMQGQPALSIDWGAITDTGFGGAAESQHFHRDWEMYGIQRLTLSQVQEAFVYLLPPQQARIAVMQVDWALLKENFPRVAAQPIFRELFIAQPVDESPVLSITQRLRHVGPEQQKAILVEHLQLYIAHILEQSTEDTAVNRSLLAIGLDSLMALELKQRLEGEFGVTIPITTFLRGPSIEEFALHLLTLMKNTEQSATSVQTTDALSQPVQEDTKTSENQSSEKIPSSANAATIQPDAERSDTETVSPSLTRQQTIELLRKQLGQLPKAQIDALLTQLTETEERRSK